MNKIEAATGGTVAHQAKIKMSNTTNIHCPEGVMSGNLITKEKRHEIFGQVAGGAGSRVPEEFQRKNLIAGTGIPCPKTTTRINLHTNKLEEIAHPNVLPNGFDYTEDFDGIQTLQNTKVYVNLKSIVGKGGAQTRSLREVYNFVKGQIAVLKTGQRVYFANILDGDEAHSSLFHFHYLLNLPENNDIKKYIYVGDLKNYFDWFKKTFVVE